MITKERLKELIEKSETIYFINGKQIATKPLKHKYHKFFITDNDELFEYNDKSGFGLWKRKLRTLYETQAEAEWVAKMHTSRTEYFKPPTWEEFLATKTESNFAHWFCGDICIVMVEENDKKGILKTHNQFEVDIYCDGDSKLEKFDYFNNYGIDTREENYIKAVEYARKLFEGEKVWK